MSDPLALVLDRLRAAGCDPRPTSSGHEARCPAHEDRSPSLSIGTGDDGRALVHCHRGCSHEAIVAALDLRASDLFPADGARPAPRPTRPTSSVRSWPTIEALVADIARGRPVKVWHYHDHDDAVVGAVVRVDEADGKMIRPAARMTDGPWAMKAMPTPRPLYRLPAVLSSTGPVFVAEGEKAADALVSIGVEATTSPGGAQAARHADWSVLAGRAVVIVPDNDEPGEGYRADVERLATAAGASSVAVVGLVDLWPDLPAGGDAHDWIEAHDAIEPDALRDRLVRAAAEAADKVVIEAPPPAVAPAVASNEWKPFPIEALPEPLRTYTAEAAAGIGVDPAMVALPLLAAAAAAIGNARRVAVRPGWIEPPVIWSALIAESGGGKTPALTAALRFVHEVQAERFRDHAAAMADHDADVAAHEERVAAWRRSRSKGTDDHPGPAPAPPTPERFVTSDSTTEALASMLSANPRGMLVAVDELAGWFGSFDQYRSGRGGADAPRWLSMHSAGPLTVDRKGTPTLFVPAAAVSVTGGIQPGTLVGALGQRHVENGMLARLVLAMPPRLPRKWTTTAPGFAVVADMTRLWGTLLAIPAPAGGPIVVDLSPDAEALFVDWYGWVGSEQERAAGPVASMLSKVEALAARLAIVIHTIRQAHHDVDEATAGGRIDSASMASGIALARWAADEARRVYRVLLADDAASATATDDEAAVRWIAERGGFVSIRDMARGLVRFKAPGAAEAVCRRLVAAGRATFQAPTTGGRPADGIRLVGRSVAAAG